MGVAVLDARGDGFAVGNLWFADRDLDAMRALQDVDLDIQVQFAHAFQDGLATLFVGLDTEGRVFCNHLAQCNAELLGSTLVLRRDSNGDNRIREDHGLQGRRLVRITEGMTCLGVLHADQRNDVAGLCRGEFLA